MATRLSFDSEDVREFQKTLINLHESLCKDWSQVKSSWISLKSTWHDEQFDKFNKLHEKLSSEYNYALEKCEQHISFLESKLQKYNTSPYLVDPVKYVGTSFTSDQEVGIPISKVPISKVPIESKKYLRNYKTRPTLNFLVTLSNFLRPANHVVALFLLILGISIPLSEVEICEKNPPYSELYSSKLPFLRRENNSNHENQNTSYSQVQNPKLSLHYRLPFLTDIGGQLESSYQDYRKKQQKERIKEMSIDPKNISVSSDF